VPAASCSRLKPFQPAFTTPHLSAAACNFFKSTAASGRATTPAPTMIMGLLAFCACVCVYAQRWQ
jgi:hypothetical protein